jgi:hypothetical protein
MRFNDKGEEIEEHSASGFRYILSGVVEFVGKGKQALLGKTTLSVLLLCVKC